MIALLLAQTAFAAEAPVFDPVSHLQQDDTQPVPTAPAAGSSGVSDTPQRPYLMEVNLRGKYMSIPDSLIDIWMFNGSDDNGDHLERPTVRAYSAGMEFAIRSNGEGGGAMGAL